MCRGCARSRPSAVRTPAPLTSSKDLLARSDEFAALWDRHEIGLRPAGGKRLIHPEVGLLDLECQTLRDPEQSHLLLVYTATPGSETYDKLQLLSVIAASAR